MNQYLEEGIITPEESMVTYGSYLKLDHLLSLQSPLSQPAEHDEMLFIVIHQVYELWFKQLLHELNLAETDLSHSNAFGALKTLKRMMTIQGILTQQVSVLETMTPNDFNRFRNKLNPASGFQSYQFRVFEFRMGLKDPAYMKFFKAYPSSYQEIDKARKMPTFQDHLVSFLTRAGYAVPGALLSRDVTTEWTHSEELSELFKQIYEDHHHHYDTYVLLEALCDFDQQFTLWRYRHVAMVERMIGNRTGTGGSSGAKYLANTLSKRFFPELWSMRGKLGGGSPYGSPAKT